MIYLDTSALVKEYHDEEGSELRTMVWMDETFL